MKREAQLAEVREFLWRHWNQREPSQLEATFYSLEGDPGRYRIFVKPDKKGRWQIIVEFEQIEAALLPPGEKPRRTTNKATYASMTRIKKDSDSRIAAEAEADPSTYQLVLEGARNAKSLTF